MFSGLLLIKYLFLLIKGLLLADEIHLRNKSWKPECVGSLNMHSGGY